MKFTVAWANVSKENSILKIVIINLSLLNVILGISCLKLAANEPIVIDRGCFSKQSNVGDKKRTAIEIEAFLKEALSQRFDSQSIIRNDFLSNEEQLNRYKEQKDLDSRKLNQKVIVNTITANNENVFLVDTDRLISVGEIRSVFRFPLNVTIESVKRSEENPYGLTISEVQTVDRGKNK